MKKMQELSPKLQELQQKYGKDPQTLQRKQMELYKEANYSPFSGCLPLLIQFPIIIAFFYVIRDPCLLYTSSASEELSSQAEMLKQMVGKFKLRSTNNSSSAFGATLKQSSSTPVASVKPKTDINLDFKSNKMCIRDRLYVVHL